MLRRLSSAASMAPSFMRPSLSSENAAPDRSSMASSSRNSTASSLLAEALSTTIQAKQDKPDPLTEANVSLLQSLESLQILSRSDYAERLGILLGIHHTLLSFADTKNTFREHGGFLTAISVLASLAEVDGEDPSNKDERTELRFELVKAVFAILSLIFEASERNRARFSEEVGFEAIQEAIKLSELLELEDSAEERPKERLMSIIFSFLTNDYSSPPLFSYLRSQLEVRIVAIASNSSEKPLSREETLRQLVLDRIVSFSGTQNEMTIENPEAVPLLLELQDSLPKQTESDLRLGVLLSLEALVSCSRRSQVGLGENGVLGIGLSRLFLKEGSNAVPPAEKDTWIKIVGNLLEMGAATAETRKLFQIAVVGWESVPRKESLSLEALILILDGVRKSQSPAFIHFDLSRQGYSCLYVRSLGKKFPPATYGYTFMAWVSIDTPPSPQDERLLIFGCGDKGGKCHVELAVTPDLHISLATVANKPPAVFKQFMFEPRRFYHIAIVQQRPKYSSSSTVTLYVDGEALESLKIAYPANPSKDADVHAWLGTPKDRLPAGMLGKSRSHLKWDLGPTWLIHGDIPEEMIQVCHALGPRYNSNFQDQLGPFLVYSSSTLLNMRIDAATRDGKLTSSSKQTSALIHAIKEKGREVIPEHRIFFSFSALNVLVSGSGRGISSSGLSVKGQQALTLATSAKGRAVVNSAVAKIEEALVQPAGLGFLQGEPCVVIPKGLDISIWKIGGVPVSLRLIELSRTTRELTVAVTIFAELVNESWRNSEDTERVQGYQILSFLLRTKAAIMSSQTHDVLCKFVGYNSSVPSESIISNPLAFRFVMIDMVLWGSMEQDIQWAHFDRLRVFVETSDYKDFNTKRLQKMQFTRKIITALKAQYFDNSMTEELVGLLMIMARKHFTTETIRFLATYLTASLCQTDNHFNSEYTFNQANNSNPMDLFLLDARQVCSGKYASALIVFEKLHDFFMEADSLKELTKFGKVITLKWCLLFLFVKNMHPYASVLAMRVLVRLLQTQGPNFVSKFMNSVDGFSVLKISLPRLWNLAQIHLALFSLLHDHDITTISLDTTFDSASYSASSHQVSVCGTEVVTVFIACLCRALRELAHSEIADTSIPTVAFNVPDTPKVDTTQVGDSRTMSMSLSSGFSLLIDLLFQSNKSVGSGQHLVIGSPSYRELVITIVRYSQMITPLDKSALGIRFNAGRHDRPPVPTLSVTTPSGVPSGLLSVTIPTTRYHGPESSISLLSAGEEDGEIQKLSEAITVLCPSVNVAIQFLGQLSTHPIISRHTHRRTASFLAETSTDPSLSVLIGVLTAGLTDAVQHQIGFRTTLIKSISRRLMRAGSSTTVSSRIVAYIAFATNLTFEGWNNDSIALLEFAFTYAEKLLEAEAVATHESQYNLFKDLYYSINHLVLFLLHSQPENASKIITLLVRYQLTVFSVYNSDLDFIRCLLWLLYTLVQETDATTSASVVDFFKLLILQRPAEVEVSLGRQRKTNYEVGIVERLLDSEPNAFQEILEDHKDKINGLESFWIKFWTHTQQDAKEAVDSELTRAKEAVKTFKHKKDVFRRRTRKNRTAIQEWGEGVKDIEATRTSHNKQDLMDQAAFIQAEWTELATSLARDCGIWARDLGTRKWKLDFTEGYLRMRKKLEEVNPSRLETARATPTLQSDDQSRTLGRTRLNSLMILPYNDTGSVPASPIIPEDDKMWGEMESEVAVDTPDSPKVPEPVTNAEQTEEAEAANGSGIQDEAENFEEDKNRKVRRNLEQGDSIHAVFNSSYVTGLYTCPTLLLLAQKNIYLVDHFFQKANGEIVDSWDAPPEERDQHLETLSDLAGRSVTAAALLADRSHASRHWLWSDLLEVHERKYLFRDVALELFFSDGQSFLITFTKADRPKVYSLIASKCPEAVAFGSLNVAGLSFGAKVTGAIVGQRSKIEQMTKRWQKRQVSNFEYLMFLNTCAGRTYNDLTNYPVFPWIIADWESEILDLQNPTTFRDLTKPMGAQSEDRRAEFADRYKQLQELEDGPTPFHYGTHYSSAMIVVGYLLRLKPFTESYLDLQGGSFDHADRLFWSIPKAWESSSKKSRSDVRELIPEFFYLPSFLSNHDNLDLGTRQEGNASIDDVILPPWSKNDPKLFVELHRQALESEWVSQHLGHWIDLIFGYRQTGEAAVKSCNVFHHLSYEGAIDLDAIEDADERKAATSTIHNFGICPRQLFNKPHPQRQTIQTVSPAAPIYFPNHSIEQQTRYLIECIVPVIQIGQQVATIYASTPEKTLATPTQTLLIPDDPQFDLSWGYADQTVRLFSKASTTLPISLFENLHSEHVSAACFADSLNFVTGSLDTSLSIWKWRWKSPGKEGHLQHIASLRGHSDQVSCVAASREYSILVSGSDDRTAIIWDLNRRRFVHRLEGHDSRVHVVAISNTTGNVVTCSGGIMRVWSVNGELLATQATSNFVDPITCVAFSLSETSPIIATGHRNGKVMLWSRMPDAQSDTKWKMVLIHALQHKDRLEHKMPSDVTALAFTKRGLYVGDSNGDVWLWNLPGTEFFLSESTGGGVCMGCQNKFGLIESRRRCGACAGIFCSLCTTTSQELGGRFCSTCLIKLNSANV